jgi:hypothetical protein
VGRKARRICVYGTSIILAGIGASLRREPDLNLTYLSAPLPDAVQLEAMAPDVVLFDLEDGRPEAAFCLLETHPELILLGLNADANIVRMWSGRDIRELSTKGLLELIQANPST